MTTITTDIFRTAPEDLAGEVLRWLTFPGEGFGCYSTFDVREDAQEWPQERCEAFWRALGYEVETWDDQVWDHAREAAQNGRGYSYEYDDHRIDVCWYWDGDGVLAFVVTHNGEPVRGLVNSDCKKDYGWNELAQDDLTPASTAMEPKDRKERE